MVHVHVHVHDAVVVGAGFGDTGAAIALRRRGLHDVVILEREDDLGGTWHVNHYPGLAVDIPSATYSYSFEPNPYWSRLYAPGPEPRRYAAHVADKHDLRRRLTPDYTFGCKRPTFSNTYFPTFTRPDVTLETSPIERIETGAVATADGTRHEIDTLVLATGFNLWDTNFPALRVLGRGGKDLGEFWRASRFQAYEGVSVPGFPNFYSLNSPYSYSGLSYFTTIESQMAHTDRLLGAMQRRGAATFEVSERVNERFLARMRTRLGDSVFTQGSCATSRSYYFTQHGEATLLRPTSTLNAFREARSFPLEDYDLAS